MSKLKDAYWWCRREGKRQFLWFICEFPGGTGDFLRQRFLKRFLRGLGEDTLIQQGFRITSPDCVKIGANCNIAEGVFITGAGGVTLGNWVAMGPASRIWSINHRYENPSIPILQQGWVYKEVTIEDDVWIGSAAFVLPGITVGRGAIIAGSAVVTKDVPPYALVAGNPARVVGWRKPPQMGVQNLVAQTAESPA